MNERCLACHEEIGWQVQRDLGLHGREKLEDCARCHPDHAGVDFELIAWEEGSPQQFRHDRTGWPLQGKHLTLECRQCHKPELQKSAVAGLLERENAARSWLGLERECVSCHVDYHQGSLESDCTACHMATGWKPASRFDHARSTFPVTDKHADVSCDKCHLIPGKIFQAGDAGTELPRYRPLRHEDCSDCHRDPHQGRLGATCAGCHVATGFKGVSAQAFDHSRTRFPLSGGHRSVDCAKCHDPERAWGKRPPFSTCESCHADPHAGRATLAGRRVDCAVCHDDRNFRPSTYSVTDHESSPYPLKGKHAAVKCEGCHPKNPSDVPAVELGRAAVLIRRDHEKCRDCHDDSHAGQLAGTRDGQECESCHDVRGFKPSTYTVARHAGTKLPLEGRHSEAECRDCHGEIRKNLPPLPDVRTLGEARVALTLIDAQCVSCHHDPHAGRFSAGGERPKENDCLSCHDSTRFRPSTLDVEGHGSFAWRLEGAHRTVPCFLCHDELKLPAPTIRLLKVEGSPRSLSFEADHLRCASCHDDAHDAQFASRTDGGACEGCHGESAFRPATRFDHDRDSTFSLAGAHRDVDCARCHKTLLDATGAPRVLYRPVPQRCRDCHRSSVGGKEISVLGESPS